MEMTSFSFLLYFVPVMLVVYFLLGRFRTAQNAWLSLCGLGFYLLNGIWCAIVFVFFAGFNYLVGFWFNGYISKSAQEGRTMRRSKRQYMSALRRIMVFSVFVNLLPLLGFVYLPAMAGSMSGWFDLALPDFPAAPLGVAILTLQGISYTVDIYRGRAQWNPRIADTFVYFSFFPTLFAGPIIKFREVAGQITDRRVTLEKVAEGFCRFVVGLAKICIIARPLMSLSDIITDRSNLSALYASAPVSLMLLGLAAAMIGMYHFFTGFSEIAIGMGKILGFAYPENFKHPQLAATVTGFWKRCYISLTAWFDEYVYDPLDQGRKNSDRMVLYMLIMWLLLGLWIGPGLPHLIFGFWNFVFILVERIVEVRSEKSKNPLRHLYVIVVLIVSVIALNTSGTYQFTLYISNLLGMKSYGFRSDFALYLLKENWIVLLLGLICSFPLATKIKGWAEKSKFFGFVYAVFYPLVMLALAAVTVLKLSGNNYDFVQQMNTLLWS